MNFAQFQPRHFLWQLADSVGVVTLNRPERKNPLTFESYAELCELFRELKSAAEVKAVVIRGGPVSSSSRKGRLTSSGR